MKRFPLFILAAAIIYVVSCQDDEMPASSEYLLVSKGTKQSETFSTLSVFKYPDKQLLERAFIKENKGNQGTYVDFLVNGNDAYALTSKDSIQKLDMNGFAKLKRIYTFPGTNFGQLDFAEDEIILSGAWSTFEPPYISYGYVMFFNSDLQLTDSIGYERVTDYYDLKPVGDKLVMSVMKRNESYLFVIDQTTRELVAEIRLDGRAGQLLAKSDTRLLALTKQGIVTVDIPNAKVEGTTPIVGADMWKTSSDLFCLDEKKNVVYYVGTTAQPSGSTYYLISVDLATGEKNFVFKSSTVVSEPIIFDANLGMVVARTMDGIIFIDRHGSEKERTVLADRPTEILIR